MNIDRRKFVRVAGSLAAGSIVLPNIACSGKASESQKVVPEIVEKVVAAKPSISKFGIQLYTLRDEMPKDPKGVLKQLSSFGYQQIEGYEGDQGLFWDMGNKDFAKYLDDLEMKMVSSHCDIFKDFEKESWTSCRNWNGLPNLSLGRPSEKHRRLEESNRSI